MSWSTSELRVRLAPLNRFKPSSKIFYWPFQGGTSFVDLLCFCSVVCLLCFVRVCLYVLCGHLLGKGWPLGSRLWCLLWVCHFPIGILGQVWYLIVSIPDLCTITYFYQYESNYFLFVQSRNIPKGSDVQCMVRHNQHIVTALHLAVSINEWLLYDLSGVELKRLLLNNWLIFTNSWFYVKEFISNAVIPWSLQFFQDIFIDRWLKIRKWNLKRSWF